MASIMYRDPDLEASFSFNLALHDFSDDEEEDKDGSSDDEYIEITLEQQPRNNFNNDDGGDGSPEELELRISFGLSRTSTVESLGNEWETATTTPTSSSSTSTLSCSSAETCWGVDHQPSKTHKSTVKPRVQFRAVNRLFNGLFSTPMPSPELVERDVTSYESRKTDANMTKAINGGGMMMKFLIKCRSINIRAVVASFMKPNQIIISSPQSNQRKKRSKESATIRKYQSSVVKPFDKWFVQREKTNHEDYKNANYNSPNSSNYSLPIQQDYGGDSSSIQAAIVHCKRSFGQTSEFHL